MPPPTKKPTEPAAFGTFGGDYVVDIPKENRRDQLSSTGAEDESLNNPSNSDTSGTSFPFVKCFGTADVCGSHQQGSTSTAVPPMTTPRSKVRSTTVKSATVSLYPLYCSVCKTRLNAPRQAAEHYASRGHARRARMTGLPPSSTGVESVATRRMTPDDHRQINNCVSIEAILTVRRGFLVERTVFVATKGGQADEAQ